MNRRLDLYLAAMGRSGSTVLCDLYSRYPSHWLMNEPWIVRGSYGVVQLERIRRFGFDVAEEDWSCKIDGESDLDRFYRVYSRMIEGLEFFGAKEVRCEFHEGYFRLMRPKRVLVLVRDIRDVIISLIEKILIENKDGYDTHFVTEYLTRNCRGLIEFYDSIRDGDVEVLKYEEFCVSEARRRQIDCFIGHERVERIPKAGNLSARPWEIERHGLGVSDKSVNRFRSEENIDWRYMYNEIPECRQYNEFFGYV